MFLSTVADRHAPRETLAPARQSTPRGVKNRRSIHRHFQTGARIDIRRIREAGQMSGYRRGFLTAFLFTAFLFTAFLATASPRQGWPYRARSATSSGAQGKRAGGSRVKQGLG